MLKKATLPAGVTEAARDRLGRTVFLSDEAMEHIEKGHPELAGCELAIARAIEVSSDRCRGRKGGELIEGREVLFAPRLGPGQWLAVVVAYDGSEGQVITAYADKNGPREQDRI